MSRFSPLKTYVPWYLVANPRSSDTHRSCHGNVATLAFERKKRARNYDDIYSSLLCQEQQFLEFWALMLHLPWSLLSKYRGETENVDFQKNKVRWKGILMFVYFNCREKNSIWQAVAIIRICLDASILMFNWESRASFTFTNPHNLAWIPASPP